MMDELNRAMARSRQIDNEFRIVGLEAMLRNYETALAESDKQRADSVGEVVRAYERIAALEAELAAAQAAHAKSHEEAADWRRLHTELLTELAPWRQMARQLEVLRGGRSFSVKITNEGDRWYLSFIGYDNSNGEWSEGSGKGKDWPAAVAAAYERVKEVGDE